MDTKEVYVCADFAQDTVQALVSELKRFGYTVREAKTEAEALQTVTDEKAHVIIVLNPGMDVKQLGLISQRAQISDSFLYFIGSADVIFPGKGDFLMKAPGVHIAGFPLNYNTLVEVIEYNRRPKKRVLVVDDEPIMLRSVKLWLGENFEVSLVNAGETAIDFLNKHPVDLVLLDYRMPGMTGPDVLRILRQNSLTSSIPVIFLTGRNDRESILSVVSLKPDGYILKSMKPEEIKAAVVNYFKTRIIQL